MSLTFAIAILALSSTITIPVSILALREAVTARQEVAAQAKEKTGRVSRRAEAITMPSGRQRPVQMDVLPVRLAVGKPEPGLGKLPGRLELPFESYKRPQMEALRHESN